MSGATGTIFVCFASSDRAVAEAVALHLREAAGAHAILDETAAHALHTDWEGGTGSEGIVLLLSRASVPEKLAREDWNSLLDHNQSPPVVSIELEPCAFPKLLERSRFLRWQQREATLRALHLWAIALQSPSGASFAPAAQPHFSGRDAELALLDAALIDRPGNAVITGAPRAGKTSLAHEFARRASGYFRSIVWVSCRGRSRSCIAGELATQLGRKPNEFEEGSLHERTLIVLDHVEEHTDLPNFRNASVLVTSPVPAPGLPVLRIEPLSYTQPVPPDDTRMRALWIAMTACRADQVPLDLAAAVAGLPLNAAMRLASALASLRLIDPLDAAGIGYRLAHPASGDECTTDVRMRHAKLTPRWFPSNIAEAKAALNWACETDWDLAKSLGKQLYSWLETEGRYTESAAVYSQLKSVTPPLGAGFPILASEQLQFDWR